MYETTVFWKITDVNFILYWSLKVGKYLYIVLNKISVSLISTDSLQHDTGCN